MNEQPKRKLSWRLLRWGLLGLAALVTLAALLVTEENWRGKRAWDNCKRELEAKGAVLDWNKYIPPSVPDDQNFFTVNTNFYLRFVKLHTAEQGEAVRRVQWLNLSNGFPVLDLAKVQPVMAEIIVTAPSAKVKSGIPVNDANARQQLQDSLRSIVGRSAIGSAGFHFSELPLSQPTPAQIALLADRPISIGELENWIPQNLFTNIGKLAVSATAAPNIFQVKFTSGSITAAADYLAWGDRQFSADLDDVRAALKCPWAMIPGDYSAPYQMPIPNFVLMRQLAQTLAQRTQCQLLLRAPDKALHELTLMHDVCRILERPPIGKPMTLVEAMINVAITGLYVNTIAEGLEHHDWHEPQLAALQQQLGTINLETSVANAFAFEPAAICRSLEITKPSELFYVDNASHGTKFRDRLLDLIPRGWIYQNMSIIARQEFQQQSAFDLTNLLFHPNLAQAVYDAEEKTAAHARLSPYSFLTTMAYPNFVKATQSFSKNQTLANQCQIACALERFYLTNGNYPETLAALAPQFLEKIPHDIINGQPLHYRRAGEKFILYSVGWNETDDGGSIVLDKDGRVNRDQGDWVWQY